MLPIAAPSELGARLLEKRRAAGLGRNNEKGSNLLLTHIFLTVFRAGPRKIVVN